MKRIQSSKKARAEEERKADEIYFKDYDPLNTAFPGVTYKDKQMAKENADKVLGPGRFSAKPIHSREWREVMFAPLTEAEEEWLKNEKNNETESDSEEENTVNDINEDDGER